MSTAGEAHDPRLRLADDGLLLSSDDSLQWIDRRGTRALRGKNLHRLHDAFAPHLDGSYCASELLAAVDPAQQRAVRSYLDTLRDAGALVAAPSAAAAPEPEPDDRPATITVDELSAATPTAVVRCGEHRVEVSLGGEASAPSWTSVPWTSRAALLFVDPEDAVRQLAQLQSLGRDAANRDAWWTLVVAPKAETLVRRAAIARWLLSTASGPCDGVGRLQIFRLGARGVTLERLAVVHHRAGCGDEGRVERDGMLGIASLGDQLDLVTSERVEQLPLTVARAASTLLGVPLAQAPGPWRFGLSYDDVRVAALCDGLAAVVDIEREATDRVVTDGVATDRDELLVAWHEERERHDDRADHGARAHEQRHEQEHATVDLLRTDGDDRIRCAQRLLRIHCRELVATRHTTRGGATRFTAAIDGTGQQLESCSFFANKAVLELLLTALWHTAYADAEPFDPTSDVTRIAAPAVPYGAYTDADALAELAERLGPPDDRSLRRVDVWGHTLWHVVSPAEATRDSS